MTSIEDKENASKVETITIDDNDTETKENINSFFSPPKKKFKQDAIPFTKLPKNEETPKKDKNDMEVESVVITLAEKKSSDDTPITKQNLKDAKSKTKSEKESESPKNIPTEKKLSKASLVAKEGIPFPKLSKEEALNESEKEAQKEKENVKTPGKVKESDSVSEIEQVNGCEETNESFETPAGKKTPASAKKTSPLSKEERQKLKEEKEQAKAARAKEIEEKRKKKEEEKLQKQAEKEKRENERKEKERLKEEEKKSKEEERKKKEEERKAREEEKKAKQEERLQKEESIKLEKEKKDAEKEKKEIERKMKEEQKKQEEDKKRLEDEAQKKKKEKAANQFRSFFTKKKSTSNIKAPVEEVEQKRFEALPIKPDALHAPLVRNTNINRELIDKILIEEIPNLDTYLKEIAKKHSNNNIYISRRKKRHEFEELRKLELNKNKTVSRIKTAGKPKSNVSMELDNNDVVVIDDNSNMADDDDDDDDTENEDDVCDEKYLYISKLLQFSENTRPPYYGTWRKKSKLISGRKPFRKDPDVFNYDVDSDEEWIDEPGENLSDAADEDEEETEETEDDQDGFFVPHGYLSDDEGIKDDPEEDDEENDKSDDKPKSSTADSNNEDKLKLKVCTFERRFSRIKHHKPICIGITYTQNVDGVDAILKDYMKVTLFKSVAEEKEKEKDDEDDMEVGSPETAKTTANTPANNIPMTVPEEAMPLLIKFVHGNVKGLTVMITKFREYWNPFAKSSENGKQISKRQLEKKIQSIASRTGTFKEGGKACYVVKDDVIAKYGLPSDLKYGETLPELKIEIFKSTSTPSTPTPLAPTPSDEKPPEGVVDSGGLLQKNESPIVAMEIN